MAHKRNFWAIAALLLLFVAASRMARISDFDLDAHENYAVFQSSGTFEDIARWTPYDWGAASFLILGAWQSLVGSDPVVLRFLSVLLVVGASACVYAAAKRLAGQRAAALAVLIYAAPAALILLSLFTRGYAVLIALLPLLLYLGLRYEEKPGLVTGTALTLSAALMLYIHATGLFAVLMFGLFMLARGGLAAVRRFSLPAVLFIVLVAPEMLGKTGAVSSRMSSFSFGLNSLQMRELLEFFAGTPVLGGLWIVLIAAAAVGLVWGRAPRTAWLLAAWSTAGFVLTFIFGGLIGSPRHSWWYLFPTALWIAWGIARLSERAAAGAALMAVVIAVAPMRLNWIDDSALPNPPLYDNLRWLTQHAQWGDVVVVDPNASCAPFPEEWDNAVRTFFPQGLRFADDPAGFSRIWYVTTDGWENPDLKAAVLANRLASIFVGPPECLLRLYAGPPDSSGIRFDNGLRFHGVEVVNEERPVLSPVVLRKAEPVRLRLWWTADQRLEANYSIAVHVYDEAGELVAQADGAPQLTSLSPAEPAMQTEMIAWEPGQLYVEERTLEIPALSRSHDGMHRLTVMLIVYQWWDGARIPAPGADSEDRLPILPIDVRSF
jgi:hypothetical protein